MPHKVGDVIDIKASKFLETPACKAEVIHIVGRHYVVREVIEDCRPIQVSEEFDCTEDGTILIGPPLNGELVRVY